MFDAWEILPGLPALRILILTDWFPGLLFPAA